MVRFIHAMKIGVVAITAALMLVSAPSQSLAGTGRIDAKILKAGFIVGVGGGNGTLTYHGRRYPLIFGGISAGTIGVSGMKLVGTASNLRNPTTLLAPMRRSEPGSRLLVVRRWHGCRTRTA